MITPTCIHLANQSEIDAFVAQGGVLVSNAPMPTQAECAANCAGPPTIAIIRETGNICAAPLPLLMGIQGSGFSSPPNSNTVILKDALGAIIQATVTGGSPTNLSLTLLNPIQALGPVKAMVTNASGDTSGTPVQVATAVNCGGGGTCPCDPLPNTLYMFTLNSGETGPSYFRCADGALGTLNQVTGPDRGGVINICGIEWAVTVGCLSNGTNPAYGLAMYSNTLPSVNVDTFLQVISCSPRLLMTCMLNFSGVPGMPNGNAPFAICDSLLLNPCTASTPNTVTATVTNGSFTGSTTLTSIGLETWSGNLMVNGQQWTIVMQRTYDTDIGVALSAAILIPGFNTSTIPLSGTCSPLNMSAVYTAYFGVSTTVTITP